MTHITAWYRSLKLRKKALALYLFWGVCIAVPLAIGGGILLQKYLIRQERDSMSHSLHQSVQQTESQFTLYNALSDYIFNNSDISDALNHTYSNNYFDMYTVLENTLIPSLRTYQLLNPGISSLAVYTDCGLPSYKKYIFPLEQLQKKEWFSLIENHSSIVWLVYTEKNHPQLISARKLSGSHIYSVTSYLCIFIDYESFFQPFSSLLADKTAVLIADLSGQTIYSSAENTRFANNCADLTDQSGDYLVVSEKLNCGWTAYYYCSLSSCLRTQAPAVAILLLVTVLIVAILLCCTYYISDTIIRPIEKLSRKVQAITDGSESAPLKTRRTDEIGELTAHFNRMIQEVYANKLQANEYQLKSLYAQINPHFLYNALGLINNKAIVAGHDDISRMALLLSQFYRTSLNNGKDMTTIENELKNIRMYIEIQKIMYSNRFEVSYQIDENLLDIIMPNFILQPIIENAIEHGLRNDKKHPKRLDITLVSRDSDILFIIRDNGCGMTDEQLASVKTHETAGIGLSNIDKRLRLCYGDNYGLHIESIQNVGTTVTVKISASAKHT